MIFKANLNYIAKHNAEADMGVHTFELGMNEFGDMTHSEFKAKYLGFAGVNSSRVRDEVVLPAANDDSVDWRTKGAVTPVKNQGQCGSCWSFSATGSMEGANFIKNGKLVSLSEQQLVDCSRAEGDKGCFGGLMDNAFEYVIKNKGIDTEADYAYTAQGGTCNAAKEKNHAVTISSYKDVPTNSEDQLKAAVAQQPVSVAIEADQPSFQFYKKGVFSGTCGTNLDHGVLVVGYGSETSGIIKKTTQDYWLVKNSWGASWGDQGYIKLAMGIAPSGQCGLTSMASYPVKKSPNPPRPPPTPPSPPPPPPPTQCDQFNTCPSGNTCCCVLGLSDRCLFWGCCPLKDAVCCKDHQTCCAEGTVCDPNGPGCLSKRTNLKSGSGARASTYQREGALFEAALKMELAENSRRPSGIAEH